MKYPSPPPRPQLDAQALARLRELDPDGRQGVVMRVLAAFDTSLARMLVQLRAEQQSAPQSEAKSEAKSEQHAAQPSGHASVVMGVAHTLKSSSASVGALALAQACADVEARLRNGDTTQLQADIVRLISEAEAALQAVRSILRPGA